MKNTVKPSLVQEAAACAAELNRLSATYDYVNEPAPPELSPLLTELRTKLRSLWERMTKEEFDAYSEQCGLKSLRNKQ